MGKNRKNGKNILLAAAVCTAGLGCALLFNGESRTVANAAENEINLSDSSALNWVSGNEVSLQSEAEVYCYSYLSANRTGNYYSASEIALPVQPGYENWEQASVSAYIDSVIYRTNDTANYSVKLDSSDSSLFTIGGYTGNAASTPGKYTARVTLTATGDKQFVTGNGSQSYSDSARGLRVTIDSTGKTAAVEKEWYLLDWGNELLAYPEASATSHVAYELNSWEFGKKAEVAKAPWLQHGDEAYLLNSNALTNSYELKYGNTTVVSWGVGNSPQIAPNWDINNKGTEDLVTFTLYRNEETTDPDDKNDGSVLVCSDAPRSQWSYYINEYTPVGEYEIEFRVKNFSLGQHNDWLNPAIQYGKPGQSYLYGGFTVSYAFEVTPAAFEIHDGGFKRSTKEIDLANVTDGTDFFGVIGEVEFTGYLSEFSRETAGFWAEADQSEYFDEAPTLKFNLARNYNNAFHAADDPFWNNEFKSPDRYRVFYQAEAKNYLPLHEGAQKYEYYFDVVLYRTLTVPELAQTEFVYTGMQITALLAGVPEFEQAFYTVKGDTALEANDEGEEYEVTISLNDKTGLYRWADSNDEETAVRKIILTYHVSQAEEDWAEAVGVVPWRYNGFVAEANRFKGVSDSGLSVTFTVARETDGEMIPLANLGPIVSENGVVTNLTQIAVLKDLAAGTYYVKGAVSASKNYKGVESDWVSFVVSPAENYWAETPKFIAWSYGGYDSSVHGKFGEAAHGVTSFLFYRLNDAGDRSGASYADISGFAPNQSYANVPAGSYEMLVTAEGGNYENLEQSVFFSIGKGKNGWLVAPNITSWLRGDAAGTLVGSPKFGTAVFTVIGLDGDTVYDSRKDDLSVLQNLNAGSYKLVAFVVGSDEHEGIPASEVKFNVMAQHANAWTVAPNIQGWTEGEPPNQPVGAARFGDVTFRYETESGTSLGDEAPDKAGNYRLIALVSVYTDPASGEQYDELYATVDFTIASKPILINSWKTVPAIQNWREGETPSEPVGEANTGNAPIFTYSTESGESLSARPSQAGNYYLIATVNANGYETLTARVPFTVLPAPAKATNRVQDLNGNVLDFVAEGVPQGAALGVSVLTDGDQTETLWKYNTQAIARVGCAVGAMYDLSLLDGSGASVQPNGRVTVTFTIPNELRNKAGLQIAHVGELGEVELLGGVVQGDKITFTTDHFSTFCLVWAEGQSKAGSSGGAIFLTVLVEFLVVAALVSAIYVWYLIWKRTKGKRIVAEIAVTVPEGQKRPEYNEMLKGQTVVPIQPDNPFEDPEEKN